MTIQYLPKIYKLFKELEFRAEKIEIIFRSKAEMKAKMKAISKWAFHKLIQKYLKVYFLDYLLRFQVLFNGKDDESFSSIKVRKLNKYAITSPWSTAIKVIGPPNPDFHR